MVSTPFPSVPLLHLGHYQSNLWIERRSNRGKNAMSTCTNLLSVVTATIGLMDGPATCPFLVFTFIQYLETQTFSNAVSFEKRPKYHYYPWNSSLGRSGLHSATQYIASVVSKVGLNICKQSFVKRHTHKTKQTQISWITLQYEQSLSLLNSYQITPCQILFGLK